MHPSRLPSDKTVALLPPEAFNALILRRGKDGMKKYTSILGNIVTPAVVYYYIAIFFFERVAYWVILLPFLLVFFNAWLLIIRWEKYVSKLAALTFTGLLVGNTVASSLLGIDSVLSLIWCQLSGVGIKPIADPELNVTQGLVVFIFIFHAISLGIAFLVLALVAFIVRRVRLRKQGKSESAT
jgi:hypothetical protein